MIKAVIFDMDGTMVSSEELWKEANIELCNSYGKKFDETVRQKIMGRKEIDAAKAFIEYFSLNIEPSEIIEKRQKLFLQRFDKIELKEGLYDLFELLNSLNIKKAMATSAFSEYAEKTIVRFEWIEIFDAIVTGDQVSHGKPHPEIFLKAAELIGENPEDCLVIEDAQNGVEAGANAGMKVIAIPHEGSKSHDFSKATLVLKSMKDIDTNLLEKI